MISYSTGHLGPPDFDSEAFNSWLCSPIFGPAHTTGIERFKLKSKRPRESALLAPENRLYDKRRCFGLMRDKRNENGPSLGPEPGDDSQQQF